MNFYSLRELLAPSRSLKSKKKVKPKQMKMYFTLDDVKAVEKYLSMNVQVRRNRLTNTLGEHITPSFKDDMQLVKEARS